MATRPPAPLDQVCAPEWWIFDSFAAYAERLAREPSSVNTLALIGHMSLRVGAMGADLDRPATDREAEAMRRRLAEALAEGAAGLSTGLFYAPSKQAPTDEVIAVAEALRARRAFTSPICGTRRMGCWTASRRRSASAPPWACRSSSATTNAPCRRTTAARPRRCR